ncbi:MAG: type II toxin-antitoxin system VapC family toxin [Dehalococcoidia bacterium]
MTMTAAWILDASVAAKWYLRDEQLLDQADQVLNQFGEGTIGLAAPTYLLDEAGNILRTAVRRGRLSSEQATHALASFLALEIVAVEATADRRTSAFALALEHDIA